MCLSLVAFGKKKSDSTYKFNACVYVSILDHNNKITTILVGGWTTRLKKISQYGNLPQFSGWKTKIFETTT